MSRKVPQRTDGTIGYMADFKMPKSAGEHWVCTALSLLGWGAALTRDGLARTDVLAVSTNDDRRMIEVQVKAATGLTDGISWQLGTKAQLPSQSEREWFVLVLLPSTPSDLPRSFVVPRDHVAAAAWISHMDWLTDPAAAKGKRNATIDRARVLAPIFAGYENRWDLLQASAYDAPVLMPPHYRLLAKNKRVGLPPGHRWHKKLPLW